MMGKRRKASSKRKKPKSSCIFCGLVLASPQNLESHIRSHTRERPYFCNFCDSAFNSSTTLNYHVNSVHLQIKYICPKCRRQFAQSNLTAHKRTCRGKVLGGAKKRKNGEGRSKGKGELRKVNRKKVKIEKPECVNEEEPPIPQNPRVPPSSIVTATENLQISGNDRVATPTVSEPPWIPFQPIDFNFNFLANYISQKQQEQRRWDPSFFLHLNRYDPNDTSASPSPPSNPPKRENDAFSVPPPKSTKKGCLPKHQRLPKSKGSAVSKGSSKPKLVQKCKDSPHKCVQCGKGYSTRGNLLKHEKIHRNEKKFVCCFCHKRFVEKCNVVRHIAAMHQNPEGGPPNTGRSSHRCGICGETFYTGKITVLCSHIGSEHHEMLVISEGAEEKASVKVEEATPKMTTQED